MFKIPSGLEGYSLHAVFIALPQRDVNDNEQVLCYRSYFPAGNAALSTRYNLVHSTWLPCATCREPFGSLDYRRPQSLRLNLL